MKIKQAVIGGMYLGSKFVTADELNEVCSQHSTFNLQHLYLLMIKRAMKCCKEQGRVLPYHLLTVLASYIDKYITTKSNTIPSSSCEIGES